MYKNKKEPQTNVKVAVDKNLLSAKLKADKSSKVWPIVLDTLCIQKDYLIHSKERVLQLDDNIVLHQAFSK